MKERRARSLWSDVLAVAYKEAMVLRHDRPLMATLLVQPVTFLIILGMAVSFTPRNVHWAVLDRSDTAIEFPDLAGARATLRPFRSDDVIATAILDADGHATLPLATSRGTALCLRLDHDDRCQITYARAGEIARPKLYVGREAEIEASCGRCD